MKDKGKYPACCLLQNLRLFTSLSPMPLKAISVSGDSCPLSLFWVWVCDKFVGKTVRRTRVAPRNPPNDYS